MKNQSKEKKRVFNIIWNSSEDYSFQPDFEIYDGQGEANLYWNYILGAVRKYYDYSQIQRFFSGLLPDPNHAFYESLTWIGLEQCIYEKGRKDRPAIEDLRRNYARKVVQKEDRPSFYYLIDEIKLAHFQRTLGVAPTAEEQVIRILDDLEFHEAMDTEQILHILNEIIDRNFPLSLNGKKIRFFNKFLPRNRRFHFTGNHSNHFLNPFRDTSILSLFDLGSTDFARQVNFLEDQKEKRNRRKKIWQDLKDQWEMRQRHYIQQFYGASILSLSQTKSLEKVLCIDNHKNCRLHFTRGEFGANVAVRFTTNDHKNIVLNQREKNKVFYQKNIARNSNSIEKLTNAIRNALLINLEASTHRAKIGNLVAGRVWRNIYLNDNNVFRKNIMDEMGNLTVDIMLDASGSHLDRQEIIATEGYIIAESLSRCRIPVKVYSYSTNRNFTVFNLFRDYDEVNKNEGIFHYYASGCNRDGLAIRSALHMMQESPAEHKILIVLSDGKPLDPQGFPGGGRNPDEYIYADASGVYDTAVEVRKGWRNGLSVVCVFTGVESDIPAAKMMYGINLVCIKTPDKFADMVGVLMKNCLKTL